MPTVHSAAGRKQCDVSIWQEWITLQCERYNFKTLRPCGKLVKRVKYYFRHIANLCSQIQSTDSLSKYICPSCWAITSNFHELFKRVQQTHHRWLRTDDDPLQKHEAHVRFNGDFEDVQQTDIKLSDNEDDTHEYGDFNLSCDQSDEQASINAIPEGQLDERQEGDDDDDDNKETDTTLAVAIASVDTEALPIRQNEQNDGPSKGAALIKLDCDICGKL